ncbi:hypothetical protein ACHAXT_012829 [Thalassiosira profunda]
MEEPANLSPALVDKASAQSYPVHASSGSIDIATANSGTQGVSGDLTLTTGDATKGAAGYFSIVTGDSVDGAGGDIELVAGSSEEAQTHSYGGIAGGFASYPHWATTNSPNCPCRTGSSIC